MKNIITKIINKIKELIDFKVILNNKKIIYFLFIIMVILIAIDEIPSLFNHSLNTLDNKNIKINNLVINEVMTSNKGYYANENGKVYDWIELYNGTNEDIDLTNYGLTDQASGEVLWTFPKIVIKSKKYLIVNLSGNKDKGLVANFSLNKDGGEIITLKNNRGRVIDSIQTIALDKGTVMARNSSGKWILTTEITPGYDNNIKGRQEYQKDLLMKDRLTITEILPKNKGNIAFDGKFYSYIELENTSSENINLKDYYLSNDANRPFLYQLPNKILKPDEVYLVYTSGINKNNHANFSLKSYTGTVVLSKKNKIVEEVNYNNLINGFAYVKNSSKHFQESIDISPGYPNTVDGIEQFSNQKRSNPKNLIIMEVMSSNLDTITKENYGWIELYNNSDEFISLNNYSLTTDKDNKKMYILPDKKLKRGEYIIIKVSNKETNNKSFNSSDKEYYANFNISSDEGIYLYKNNKLIDSIFIGNIPIDYSYGRNSENGFYYFSRPTPEERNSENVELSISEKPTFSKQGGVYNQKELMVEIDGGETIFYTLDGSEPTVDSKVYTEPIVIKETTVLKAFSYDRKKKTSQVMSATYIMNENHKLPVMSISADNNSLQEIYNNEMNDITIPAHAEFYEQNKSFTVDCGLKLFGSAARTLDKKSYSLKFLSRYGTPHLDYKVFDRRDVKSYDTIILRSGSQDYIRGMLRDELVTSIMNDYGTVDVQDYKAIVLYINGKYEGIYFIREKVDDEFISNHYNVSSDDVNIIHISGYASKGSDAEYKKLLEYVKNNDLSNEKNYKYVQSKLDINNFIDYWVGELFVNNTDVLNNTRFFNHPDIDNGRFKMIFYDFDYSLYGYTNNFLEWIVSDEDNYYHYDNILLKSLMKNENFKQTFLERLAFNLNYVWNEKNMIARLNELIELIKPEMKRNQERWNLTYDYWEEECKNIKDFIKKRRKFLIEQSASFFGLTNKDSKKYFEGGFGIDEFFRHD